MKNCNLILNIHSSRFHYINVYEHRYVLIIEKICKPIMRGQYCIRRRGRYIENLKSFNPLYTFTLQTLNRQVHTSN